MADAWGGSHGRELYPDGGLTMIEGTQLMEGLNENTMINSQSASPRSSNGRSDEDASFGLLHRLGGKMEEYKLKHRVKDNVRDKYVVGRAHTCDIVVNNKMVSSNHCAIYCDWTGPRLVVYLEDMSANGTYVNDKDTKLNRGQRMELKSGDEVFLINPSIPMEGMVAQGEQHLGREAAFMFVNLRERLANQRSIATAPRGPAEVVRDGENAAALSRPRHIEDSYVIGDQIGSGMCGTVHICTEIATKNKYAVKIIDTKKFGLQPGLAIGDLKEEARMMMTLNHPHIVRVQDTFEFEHMIYIVMELVEGGDLFDRIVSKQRYSEQEARQVMMKVLDAVSYLHSRDIIHRDLKPENILLTYNHDDCDIKLTDFGLAKRTNQDGLKTFCGTPQYFAPEVLMRKSTVKGMGSYGRSADMWSIGVILFILLSGTFPFEEDNLLDAIECAQYSTEREEWLGVSESAKHLVKALMTLRPDRRVTVEQARSHPWIQGFSTMPLGFSYCEASSVVVKIAPPAAPTSLESRAKALGGAEDEGNVEEKKVASLEGVWQHFKQPQAQLQSQSQSQSQSQGQGQKKRVSGAGGDGAGSKRAKLLSFRKGAGSKGAAAGEAHGADRDRDRDSQAGGRGSFNLKQYLQSPQANGKRPDPHSSVGTGSGERGGTSLYSLITGKDERTERDDLDSRALGLAPWSPPASNAKTKAGAAGGSTGNGKKSAGRSPARRSPQVGAAANGSGGGGVKRGRERSGSGDAAAGTACLESFWGRATSAAAAPTSVWAGAEATPKVDKEAGDASQDKRKEEVTKKGQKTAVQPVVTPLGKHGPEGVAGAAATSRESGSAKTTGDSVNSQPVHGAVVSLEKDKENFPMRLSAAGTGSGTGSVDAGDSASAPMPTEGCLKGGSLRSGNSRRKLRQPIKNLTFADIFKRPAKK